MLLMPGILMKNKILRNCRRSPGLESTYAGIFFPQRKRITRGLASRDDEKTDLSWWANLMQVREARTERTAKCWASSPASSSGGSPGIRNRDLSSHPHGNRMSLMHSVPHLLSFISPGLHGESKATKFLVYVCVSRYVCIHGNVWGSACTHACKCWHICAGKRSVSALTL